MIQTSDPSWPSQALTALTRSTTAVGLPIYLLSSLYFPKKVPSTPLLTASLVVLASPSTLLCALGAIEGVVRSCGKLFSYCYNRQSGHHWDLFRKEITTTHGLIRGTLSPISGYTILANEWSKEGPISKTGSPRLLKEEYLVYRTLRAFGRAINQIVRSTINGIRWTYNFVIDTTAKVIKAIWSLLQPALLKIWNGACWIVNKAAEAISYVGKLTKPIRDFVIKTVVMDWIATKLIWNIGVKIILAKVIWPPVKFIAQEIIWRILKFGAHVVSTVVHTALGLITWTTRQIFRGGS